MLVTLILINRCFNYVCFYKYIPIKIYLTKLLSMLLSRALFGKFTNCLFIKYYKNLIIVDKIDRKCKSHHKNNSGSCDISKILSDGNDGSLIL